MSQLVDVDAVEQFLSVVGPGAVRIHFIISAKRRTDFPFQGKRTSWPLCAEEALSLLGTLAPDRARFLAGT